MSNLAHKVVNQNGNDMVLSAEDIEFSLHRTITLDSKITSAIATKICSELRCLARDSEDDIILYINSPGGSVSDGMAIYDTMQAIPCEVSTICIGMAASMAAILLMGGTKGKRYALPNAEVMIHQPLGGTRGQAEDIRIHAEHILRTRDILNKIISERTGQPLDKVEVDTERDNYMTAKEALAYGLVDHVGDPIQEV